MKRILPLLACMVWVSALPAQDSGTPSADTGKVITLAEAVDQALKTGDTPAQIQANLEAAQAARDLTFAKNSFTIAANLGYGASQSYNTPGQATPSLNLNPYSAPSPVVPVSSAGTPTTDGLLFQSPTASIIAGTPLTSLTLGGGTGLEALDGTVRNVGTVSAKLSQTIWNGYWGGPTQAAADKASMAFESTRLTSQANRNTAVLAVKQAYYTMLAAQENIVLLQAALDSWNKTLQIIQFKFDQKTETAVDVLTAQVSVRGAELNLLAGRNALVTARQRLANLMGIPADSSFRIVTEPDPTTPAKTLQDAVALGLRNRPELQAANLNAKSSEVDLNLAYGNLIPMVTVTGGVTDYIDTTAPTQRSTLVGQIGVTLGAALWDAGAGGSSISQAQKTRQAYLTQVHQLSQSIPVDIQEGWNTWQVDLQKMAVAVDNKRAFDELLEITRTQFEAGQKALSDLLTAQTNASNADFGLLQAKITAQLAALQVQNLLGL